MLIDHARGEDGVAALLATEHVPAAQRHAQTIAEEGAREPEIDDQRGVLQVEVALVACAPVARIERQEQSGRQAERVVERGAEERLVAAHRPTVNLHLSPLLDKARAELRRPRPENRRDGCEDGQCGQAIEVAVSDERHLRVRRAALRPVDDGVALLSVAGHQLHDAPRGREAHVVRHGRLQQRVARLERESVGVVDVAAELAIRRALRLGRVGQLEADSLHLRAERHIREPLVVAAVLAREGSAVAEVIGADMLVAQPDAELPDRRLPCILRKEATVPFVRSHIRRRDNALGVAVYVRAMRADVLATDGQFAAKDGVRQDQLRRCEPVAYAILRVHHAVFLHATRLHGMRTRRASARVEIDVEVDPQAAHRAVVIRIETVRWVVRRAACIVAMPFVVKGRVGVNHAVESRVVDVVAQGWRERVAKADVVRGRDLPIGARRDAHPPIDARGVERVLLLPEGIEAGLLRDAAVDEVRPAAVERGAEDVPAVPVVSPSYQLDRASNPKPSPARRTVLIRITALTEAS